MLTLAAPAGSYIGGGHSRQLRDDCNSSGNKNWGTGMRCSLWWHWGKGNSAGWAQRNCNHFPIPSIAGLWVLLYISLLVRKKDHHGLRTTSGRILKWQNYRRLKLKLSKKVYYNSLIYIQVSWLINGKFQPGSQVHQPVRNWVVLWGIVMGWTVYPKNIDWRSPNAQYLWMWAYLEIESLQMRSKWGHRVGPNPIWLMSL